VSYAYILTRLGHSNTEASLGELRLASQHTSEGGPLQNRHNTPQVGDRRTLSAEAVQNHCA
jgi:hypothetical protein